MRLLRKDGKSETGWTSHIWLIWLAYFIAEPAFHPFSVRRWALTLVATLVFLTLYFWGWKLEGQKQKILGDNARRLYGL